MIFIDTGAFVARFIQRDQYHRVAAQQWDQLIATRSKCFTSNFVIDETIMLVARTAGYSFAAGRARNIFQSEFLTILRPNERDEIAALTLFERYADQGVSYTDCISFVLMESCGIQKVFAFDRHFSIHGLTMIPSQ